MVVQRFGTQIFNDGLRQTLRLKFPEFEDQRSGETLSLLLRVRRDTERLINAFINVLYALADRAWPFSSGMPSPRAGRWCRCS